jgi:hypothetical protein
VGGADWHGQHPPSASSPLQGCCSHRSAPRSIVLRCSPHPRRVEETHVGCCSHQSAPWVPPIVVVGPYARARVLIRATSTPGGWRGRTWGAERASQHPWCAGLQERRGEGRGEERGGQPRTESAPIPMLGNLPLQIQICRYRIKFAVTYSNFLVQI